MKIRSENQQGFTLLEMIASLVLLGILAVVAGLGFVQFSDAFVFARDANALAQKSNISMQRITRAVTNLTTIDTAAANEIQIKRFTKNGQATERYHKSGDRIYINSDPLVDKVSTFNITYRRFDNGVWDISQDIAKLAFINISIGFTGPDNNTSSLTQMDAKVTPRNTFVPEGTLVPGGTSGQAINNMCFISSLWGSETQTATTGTAGGPRMFVQTYGQYVLIGISALAGFLLCMVALRQRLNRGRTGSRAIFPGASRKGISILVIILAIVFAGALGASMVSMLNSTSVGTAVSTFSPKAYYMAESGLNYAAYRYESATGNKDAVITEMQNQTRYTIASEGSFKLDFEPFWFNHAAGAITAGQNTFTSDSGLFPGEFTPGATGRLLGNKTAGTSSPFTVVSSSGGNLVLNLASDMSVDSDGDVYLAARVTDTNKQLLANTTINVAASDLKVFPPVHGVVALKTNAASGVTYALYEKVDYATGKLINLTSLPSEPEFTTENNIVVANSSDAVLQKFARITATGYFGPSNLEAARTIVYSQPLYLTKFYTKRTFDDNFDDGVSKWTNLVGQKAAASLDGNGVMRVAATQGFSFYRFDLDRDYGTEIGSSKDFLTGLDWRSIPGLDLAAIWASSDNTLSYDIQVKVRFNQLDDRMGATGSNTPATYMPGLGFRLNRAPDSPNRARYYGASFFRGGIKGQSGGLDYDNIPDTLFDDHGSNSAATNPYTQPGFNCMNPADYPWETWNDNPPKVGRPYIALWSRDVQYAENSWGCDRLEDYADWLAYHSLAEETSTTLYYYTSNQSGYSRNGWYDGKINPGDTPPSKPAIRLVDKSGVLATTLVSGVTVMGIPGTQVDSTNYIGAVLDPATGKPVARVDGRSVGYIFPSSGDANALPDAFVRTNNYRIYLKDWVTLMARVFELKGDFDCGLVDSDDDYLNIIQLYFAGPDDGIPGAIGDPDDYVRKPMPRGTVRWPEDGDYLTFATYQPNAFTSAVRRKSIPGCFNNPTVKMVERAKTYDSYTGTWSSDYTSAITDFYTTEATGPSDFEVGLATFGIDASTSNPNSDKLYFEDFSMVIYELNTSGLIRGIQQ